MKLFSFSFLSSVVCLQMDINSNNPPCSGAALGNLFQSKVPVLLTHCALLEQSLMSFIFPWKKMVILGELFQGRQFMLKLLIHSKFLLPTFSSQPHLLQWGKYFTSSEKFHSSNPGRGFQKVWSIVVVVTGCSAFLVVASNSTSLTQSRVQLASCLYLALSLFTLSSSLIIHRIIPRCQRHVFPATD